MTKRINQDKITSEPNISALLMSVGQWMSLRWKDKGIHKISLKIEKERKEKEI